MKNGVQGETEVDVILSRIYKTGNADLFSKALKYPGVELGRTNADQVPIMHRVIKDANMAFFWKIVSWIDDTGLQSNTKAEINMEKWNSLNCVDKQHRTPLMTAYKCYSDLGKKDIRNLRGSYEEILGFLINCQMIALEIQDKKGHTILHNICEKSDNDKIPDVLLDRIKQEDSKKQTALVNRQAFNGETALQVLLKRTLGETKRRQCDTQLTEHLEDLALKMFGLEGIRLDTKDSQQTAALHHLCNIAKLGKTLLLKRVVGLYNEMDTDVQLKFRKQLCVDIQNANGESPLSILLRDVDEGTSLDTDIEGIVGEIVSHGTVNINSLDGSKRNILHYFITHGLHELVEKVLENPNCINLNEKRDVNVRRKWSNKDEAGTSKTHADDLNIKGQQVHIVNMEDGAGNKPIQIAVNNISTGTIFQERHEQVLDVLLDQPEIDLHGVTLQNDSTILHILCSIPSANSSKLIEKVLILNQIDINR